MFWTVQSSIEPVTFTSEHQAKQFKRLLDKSLNVTHSDIVRREVTEEGYHPTYGDERT